MKGNGKLLTPVRHKMAIKRSILLKIMLNLVFTSGGVLMFQTAHLLHKSILQHMVERVSKFIKSMMRLILWITATLMDNLTAEQHLKNMRRIRSVNGVAEKLIMCGLKRRKIYFAKHVRSIIGNPDIVFRRKRIIVFIDSEFWHMHPERCKMPRTNSEYWENKLNRNRKRDAEVNAQLLYQGWTVLRFWEFEIKKDAENIVSQIISCLDK